MHEVQGAVCLDRIMHEVQGAVCLDRIMHEVQGAVSIVMFPLSPGSVLHRIADLAFETSCICVDTDSKREPEYPSHYSDYSVTWTFEELYSNFLKRKNIFLLATFSGSRISSHSMDTAAVCLELSSRAYN
jgi:hypothetical protein